MYKCKQQANQNRKGGSSKHATLRSKINNNKIQNKEQTQESCHLFFSSYFDTNLSRLFVLVFEGSDSRSLILVQGRTEGRKEGR
jgi:hypothetical protein